MNIGERLKQLRTERGYSQEDVAKLIGVGRTTYLKYENGDNKPTRKLKELSALFGVTTDYLLGNNAPAQAQAAAPKKPRKLLELIQDEEYTLNGQVATPEDREKIARVIEALYYDAKEKNKRK